MGVITMIDNKEWRGLLKKKVEMQKKNPRLKNLDFSNLA